MTKIFVYFLKEVIDRLNRTPDKNLIAFLDILGLKLLPALPARTPITFKLSDGTLEHVLVPEGSQIAAGEIIFETEENMLATPAKLVEAFCVDVADDKIYRSPSNVVSGQPEIPFHAKLRYDTQKGDNEIFLDKTEGLNAGDTINIDTDYVIVSEVLDGKATLKDKLTKRFNSGSDIKRVSYFELFNGKNLQEHILYFGHDNLFNFSKGIGEDCHIYLDILFEGMSKWQSYQREKLGTLKWEYWSGDKWQPLKKREASKLGEEPAKVALKKSYKAPSQKGEINGTNTFWIRCIGSNEHTGLPFLESMNVSIDSSNGPDMCFYNDTPVNLESNILPFGKTPKIHDTFYIASQECFSKKGEKITLTFEGSRATALPETLLSWEYWNGKTWMAIEDLEPSDYKFQTVDARILRKINQPNSPTSVTFTCPEDIEPNEVNGEMNHWLKIRILNGGYGNLVYCNLTGCTEYFKINIDAPIISDIKIRIKSSHKKPVDNLLTFNALKFKDITTEGRKNNSKTFKLFNPLGDERQTLYFGFDQKLEKGPISLFLSIDEYPWPENNLPRVKWYYYNENDEWASLDAIDKTLGLTRSDVVEFVVPSDFKKIRQFGKELFWIKAVDVEDRLKLQESRVSSKSRKQSKVAAEVKPCPSLLELFNPEWSFPGSTQIKASGPLLRGIYLNATWGVQWESIKDEIIGSSDGTVFQSFKTLKSPVISEEVWINEFNTILESEMERIINDKEFRVREVYDIKGNLTEFWVRWKAEEDILFAKNQRYYEIDNYTGELKFGDGEHGKIPPIGRNNIKINYHTGGGSKGNLPTNEIKTLKSTIASVDKAYNPLPSEGGSDVESIENIIERGPKRLKNRNRAITIEDYEEVTKEASQSIARVKCLPNFDEKGENTPGHVTILIIPQSLDDRPKLSLELKKQVEDYLYNRSPNTMILEVSEPVYVGVSVNLHLISLSANAVPSVEKEAYEQLKRFLNPLIGGFDGKGWDFGRMPCISDFYNLLENIDNVDYVKDISITLNVGSGQEYVLTPDKNVEVRLAPYSMIYSSTHTVNIGINTEDV